MNKSDFLSLGTTRQLQYINGLEESNRQLKELVRSLEKENKCFKIETKHNYKCSINKKICGSNRNGVCDIHLQECSGIE